VKAVVHTSDLDLGTRAGQRALDLRLARAAREVCGSASDADLRGKNAVRKCRDEVLASAMAQKRELSRGADIAIASAH
jgi:UrcA family protein